MKKGCIFDLDGTLIDSLEDLADACNAALRELNYPTWPLENYKLFVGSGVRNLIKRALPCQDGAVIDRALELFYAYYNEHCLDKTKVYEGINEVLQELQKRDYALAVVTNKPDFLAKKIVQHFFKDSIKIVYGQVEGVPVKPDPTFVFKAMADLDMDKQHSFYIGDSDVDIYTAENAQLKSIGCLWGNRTKEELCQAGAMYIAEKSLDILEKVIQDDDHC